MGFVGVQRFHFVRLIFELLPSDSGTKLITKLRATSNKTVALKRSDYPRDGRLTELKAQRCLLIFSRVLIAEEV